MVVWKFYLRIIIALTGILFIQCAKPYATPEGSKMIFESAQEDLRKHRFEEAKYNFRRVYTEFPESDLADNALFRLGYIACIHEDYSTASRLFKSLLDDYPKSEWRFDSEVWYKVLNSWSSMSSELDNARSRLGILTREIENKDEGDVTGEIDKLQQEINRLMDENRKLRELLDDVE